MLRFGAAIFLYAIAVFAIYPVEARSQACTGWNALYTSSVENEDGSRVVVEFATGEGTEPHPLILTGHSRAGKKLWWHRGLYWCYQGSGGCYASLDYGQEKTSQDEDELRLVFANAKPGKPTVDRAPNLLVIAGVNSAFIYGQNGGGLVIDYSGTDREPVFIPEVFYFDRCKADK